MSAYAVIGTSPWSDVTVACGPYRSERAIVAADRAMEQLGYVTEVVELGTPSDLGSVVNDEGVES